MTRLANVLIVEENSSRAKTLHDRLGRAGYHAATVRSGAEAAMAARTDHPDLVLLGTPEDGGAIELGRTLKADSITGDIPVLLLTGSEEAGLCSEALEANLDEVIAEGCDDVELVARLRPLVRLSTMHAELRQRARTANTFGLTARERVGGPDSLRPALLLIGDAAAERRKLFESDATVTTSLDLFEAEDLLARRNFDAALIAFSNEPDGLLGFCLQVRNNPRLFNLPLVLLHTGERAEAYRKGATRVLPADADAQLLRAVTLTLVRRQQLRWNIRAAFNDTLKGVTRDASTGAYSRSFLDAYLNDRLAAAKARDRHLSLIFFAAPNIDNVYRQFGEDAAVHLRQQIGQWITGLLRAEDLTACYDSTEFCVVLPDTPLAEAEVVMHRIAGILAYTDFAVREVYQPVKVWVQSGCTDAQGEADMAGLVAHARRNLD